MNLLKTFRNWKEIEEFDPQAVILSEGDPADAMYFILSGKVELTLHGHSIGFEQEGGFVGEMALIDSATRTATVTARTPVRLARLDRRQFEKMMSESTEFAQKAMNVLANRLRAVDKFIISRLDQKDTAE